jgi:hypothetical protein
MAKERGMRSRHEWLESEVTQQGSIMENLSWSSEWKPGQKVIILRKDLAEEMYRMLDEGYKRSEWEELKARFGPSCKDGGLRHSVANDETGECWCGKYALQKPSALPGG